MFSNVISALQINGGFLLIYKEEKKERMGESRYTVGCTSTFFLSSVILSIIALVRHVTPVQTPPHPHTLYLVVSPFVLLLPLLFLLLGSSCSYALLGYCAPPWAGLSIRYECTDQSRALRLSVLGTAMFLSNFFVFWKKKTTKTFIYDLITLFATPALLWVRLQKKRGMETPRIPGLHGRIVLHARACAV